MQMVNYFKNFLYYLENQGKYSVQFVREEICAEEKSANDQ